MPGSRRRQASSSTLGTLTYTLHDARSTGKSITALAVGIAIGRGVLPGVDAKVFPYLADLQPFAGAGPLKDAITVEDLLTMSSALDCDDDDPRNPGNEENMYPQPAWARWAVDLPTRADYRRDASGRGPWHYCTAGTFLLGQVLQRAAGLHDGRQRGDARVVLEDLRGCRRAALHAVHHDHIRAALGGQLDVVEDARRTDLDEDRHLPVGGLAQLLDLDDHVVGAEKVGMAGRTALIDAGREVADFRDLRRHL